MGFLPDAPAPPRSSALAAAIASALTAALVACAGDDVGEAAADAAAAEATLADSLATWYALGINAHHLCAGLWVVGRDHRRTPERVIAEDIAPFHFGWSDDFDYDVDEGGREVTLASPGVEPRTAVYNADQGCTLLPAGADGVFFEPRDVSSSLPDPADQAWPTGDRDARAEPAGAGVDREALDAALDFAFDDQALDPPQNTRGLVVIHDGRIVAERYAEGWGPYTPQISWSMGKSIAATLMGVLIEQGEYELHEPAPVPAWGAPGDPRGEIRISDLLRMSSGLDFDNFGLSGRASYSAANEHMRIYFDALDVYLHGLNQPPRFEPGEVWRYRNSDPLTVTYLARRAVEARGEDFLAFPREHLFDRIGMRSMVLETDPWGNFVITGYDYGGTRDWARFGLLYLRDGVWEGERILPEGWVDFVTTPAPGDPSEGYGGLFWLNRGGRHDRIPEDAFWAAGHMGQTAMVIPSRDVVVVRHGPSTGGFDAYLNRLVGDLLDAIEPAAGS